jgi:hypothetical protein
LLWPAPLFRRLLWHGHLLSAIVSRVDQEQSDQFLEELRRLGPEGVRAAEMLMAAAEHVERPGIRAGNQIAYCVREALMSLLDMGGKRERLVSDTASRVVGIADELRRERASQESLLDAVQELAVALEGPGPHIARLQTLIGSLARRPPVRAEADLLDAYKGLLSEVNALHADVAVDSAVELYSRARVTLARLFGPMTARLEEIDPLTRITEPTEEAGSRLASLAGDPRTLGYFYSRLDGPGWLHALADHPLLQPPEQGPWFAYGYLMTLAKSHPEDVGSWLRSRPSGRELSDHQALLLIAIARAVAGPVTDAVLHLAMDRTGDAGVLHQIAGYLEELPAGEHTSDAVISLVKRALDGVTREGAPADDSYLSAGVLSTALSVARQGQSRRWLGILTAKLAVACDHYPTEVRSLQAIDGLTLTPDVPVFDQFVASVRDVARLAASAGMPTAERIERLGKLPAPIAGRLIASHLIDTVDLDATAALVLITDEVTHHDPMPETLKLLGELTERKLPGLDQRMLQALGNPPSAEEVAALDDAADFPRTWTHAFGWLIAMPASVKEVWSAANECVEGRWRQASPNGFLWPEPSVISVPPATAIGVEELAELEPLEAARRIAAWKPTAERRGATLHDAARELQQVINNEPQRWLAQAPAPILEALRDPMYAERYLNALADHVDELHERVPEILGAVEFAERELTRESAPGEFDGYAGWGNVVSTGIDLISKLAAAGAPLGSDTNRGWELIERAARRREEWSALDEQADAGSFQHAIYRRSMRALGDAFVYAGATTDGGSEPDLLLALLDEALDLEPSDGRHARAIIGRNLAWLASRAPEWTHSRWSRLVGPDAPAGLGPHTFDQYLEWGAPAAALLTEHRDLYEAAVARVPDHVRRHLLHALIWGLDGYDPAVVLEILAVVGDSQVSEAIQWLAFGAFHQPEMPLEHSIEFLRLALKRDLCASTYAPLGWLSRVERIDSETWLDLTLSAAQAVHRQLDQANHIAERAAKHPHDQRAIRIVAALLDADLKLWYLEDVGRAGLQLLKGHDPATQAARDELREQLLRREFFDAYGDHK